jgi:1-aminocyclopropane-1-carboxylate deaminase
MSAFAEEVRAQEKELGFAFDYIVVCTVTGSTHAGMLVGFAKDGRARKVIGIDASFTPRRPRPRCLTSPAVPPASLNWARGSSRTMSS